MVLGARKILLLGWLLLVGAPIARAASSNSSINSTYLHAIVLYPYSVVKSCEISSVAIVEMRDIYS